MLKKTALFLKDGFPKLSHKKLTWNNEKPRKIDLKPRKNIKTDIEPRKPWKPTWNFE